MQSDKKKSAFFNSKQDIYVLSAISLIVVGLILFWCFGSGVIGNTPAEVKPAVTAVPENTPETEPTPTPETTSAPEPTSTPEPTPTPTPKPTPTPTPSPTPETTYRTGKIFIVSNANANKIKVRKSPGLDGKDTGERLYDGDKVTVYEETEKDGFTWYRIGDNKWCAGNGTSFGIEFDK